jgi:pimeloyl-ACP methyl ester carboxylesterase
MRDADKKYFLSPIGKKNSLYWIQEWNPLSSKTLLFVHGFPGCGEQAKLMTSSPLLENVRLISIDRPGYHKSPNQKKITPQIFADQCLEVLGLMKVDQLSILSVSGGAPYAMALAHKLKNRVQKISSIAGVAPLTVKNFRFMNKQQKKAWVMTQVLPPKTLEWVLNKVWQKGADQVEKFLFNNIESFSLPDQKVFLNEKLAPVLIATLRASLEQGPKGIAQDMRNYARRWQIPTHEIHCPVTLWHGTEDDIVHQAYSIEMKKRLPLAQLKIIPGEGHYSLPMNYRDEILEDLLIN